MLILVLLSPVESCDANSFKARDSSYPKNKNVDHTCKTTLRIANESMRHIQRGNNSTLGSWGASKAVEGSVPGPGGRRVLPGTRLPVDVACGLG